MARKICILFILIFLLFVSARDSFSVQSVTGKVYSQDKYGGRYPANGVSVRLCTRDRACGPLAITNIYGQYFLYNFPRGSVVLEVYPKGLGGRFVHYFMYVGNDTYWALPPVTILLH